MRRFRRSSGIDDHVKLDHLQIGHRLFYQSGLIGHPSLNRFPVDEDVTLKSFEATLVDVVIDVGGLAENLRLRLGVQRSAGGQDSLSRCWRLRLAG
jgi:hypothetical protein